MILEAFPVSRVPDLDSMLNAYPESFDAVKDLAEYQWNEVPDHVLRYHYDAMGWIEVPGILYYLPAFLLMVVDNAEVPDGVGMVAHSVACNLADDNLGLSHSDYEELISCMTKRQRQCLFEWLKWLASHPRVPGPPADVMSSAIESLARRL